MADRKEPAPSDAPATRSIPGPRPKGGLQVLVVEDNAGDRWYFSELLRSRGFSVVSCEDAESAWEVFADAPPPIVLLDILLPGMDGEELCRRMRGHPRGPESVILAVTGQDDPEALDRILEAGADDFVRKPVDPLLLDVRLVIAERWIEAQAEQRSALERMNEQLTRRNEELALLNRLAEISLASDSSEEALEGMLGAISDALGLPLGAVEQVDRDAGVLVVTATRGVPLPRGPAAESPLHRTLPGRAITEAHPVQETDPRAIRDGAPDYLAGRAVRFLAAVPMIVGGEASGVLVLASEEPVAPHAYRARLAMRLARSMAALVERLEAEDALRENEARYRLLATQLQQANTELESFAYSISHDLRAPLRTMQGFAHALIQHFGDQLDEEAKDYARRIIASGRQSEELISDLLAYSRLSFEELELKPVELGSVVELALDQVRADREERSAEIDVRGPLPEVLGSQTILVQVVTNLLANAIKFVPEDRRPAVVVRSEPAGDQVRLWIEDNGVGIPPGQEERIFRVFERLTGSGDQPGTGIGLAIVRRGVQRIGGRCGVESRPEGGAAFWIQIPRERRSTPRGRGRRR